MKNFRVATGEGALKVDILYNRLLAEVVGRF